MPTRIQRRRTRGWRLPPNVFCVTRPGRFGNPFSRRHGLTPADAVELCRKWLLGEIDEGDELLMPDGTVVVVPCRPDLRLLRGKDLACWCRLCDRHQDGKPHDVECPDCAPCHADVLLELANR